MVTSALFDGLQNSSLVIDTDANNGGYIVMDSAASPQPLESTTLTVCDPEERLEIKTLSPEAVRLTGSKLPPSTLI